MMVSPISSVRFTGETSDIFSRPGAFTKPAQEAVNTEVSPKKKSKAGKIVLGTLLTAAVLAGTAVALRKFCPDTFKILESTEGAKFLDKAKHYVAKTGQYILDKCSELGSRVKNLKIFKKEA